MLKFWKKTAPKENAASGASSPSRSPCSTYSPTHSISIDVDELVLNSSEVIVEKKYSRLSKPLIELMSESESLGYFMQFLETMNVVSLAKCLLDIDHLNVSFQSESGTVLWKDVKGVIQESTNNGRWTLVNGVEYSSNTACDISNFCEIHDKTSVKNCSCDKRPRIRAVSGAKLKEMETIEEKLAKLFESDLVTESTVDALRIFYKYFSFKATSKIILMKSMFERIVDKLFLGELSTVYSDVRQYIFGVLEREYYNEFMRSEFHCKYQISILTGTQVQIADILYNESALFYFMEFLEQEGSRSLLEFWMAANNFEEQYRSTSNSYDTAQAQADAMVLYDKYFSLQATQPLHLGDKVRFAVEENICMESGPHPTCFASVQNLITRYLEIKYLPAFLQSQLYFNFLSEVISTVNAGPANRSGGSDCSSEVSISVTNTLLVSEDSTHTKRIARNWDSGSLNIDSRQLYDPDSLWRRGKQTKLSFGRVNSLGRFETDVEPEPDRKLGLETRISKAVKRLVNLEEDKSKEEMAWQVAEMIVKDVTSLTMPDSN